MDWYHLYLDSKFCTGQFAQLKGYRNRKRIWSDVEEIFRQIRVLRGEGKCERDWTGWLPDWWEPICGNMYDSWDEGDVEVYWGGGEYGVGNLERDFVDESDSDEDMGF